MLPVALAAPLMGGLSALAKRIQTTAIVAGVVSGITYMFKTKLGMFIMGALVWLGLSFGSMALVVQPALDVMYGYLDAAGAVGQYAQYAMKWVGVMNLDRAVTMIGSSIAARHAANAGRMFLFARGHGSPAANPFRNV